jgi:hypothetical protein
MKLLHIGGMVGMKYPVMPCNFPRRRDASNVTLYFRFSVPCIFYRLQINVPTDATNFIYLFLMFLFTLHVSGLYWPIIRGVLSCCYATIWLLPGFLPVRASVEGGLVGHLPRPHGQSTSMARAKW